MSAAEVVRATQAHEGALRALFEASACTCFCRWWHFEGDKNDWLARNAEAPEASARELFDALREGRHDARGMVALAADGRAVGWLKLAPATSMGKLYGQKPWRGLPIFAGDRAGVLTIGCLLVDPGERRRGVARALVAGAIVEARRVGATAIEAFPRRVPEGAHDADLWLGPEGALAEAGFRVVHEIGAYPVLRWTP